MDDKTQSRKKYIFSHVVYWASHGKAFREGNGSIFSQKSKHALNLARLSPPPVSANNQFCGILEVKNANKFVRFIRRKKGENVFKKNVSFCMDCWIR